MTATSLKASIISLSNTFGPLVVKGDGIEVGFIEGLIVVRSGTVQIEDQAKLLPGTAVSTGMRIGDTVLNGLNAGWVYCETQNKEPFLVAPKDSGMMGWREALDYASRNNAKLPTSEQLSAMYEARNKGGLKETFNLTGHFHDSSYWCSELCSTEYAWYKNFSEGNDGNESVYRRLSLRCVRTCSNN